MEYPTRMEYTNRLYLFYQTRHTYGTNRNAVRYLILTKRHLDIYIFYFLTLQSLGRLAIYCPENTTEFLHFVLDLFLFLFCSSDFVGITHLSHLTHQPSTMISRTSLHFFRDVSPPLSLYSPGTFLVFWFIPLAGSNFCEYKERTGKRDENEYFDFRWKGRNKIIIKACGGEEGSGKSNEKLKNKCGKERKKEFWRI